MNSLFSSKPQRRPAVTKLALRIAAAVAGVAMIAEPALAQTFRFRNETSSKLVAYRAVSPANNGGVEPVEVKRATLEPGTSGFAPEPTPESVYYSPEAKRGIAMRLTVTENEDGKKSEVLSIAAFEGTAPWPAADSRGTPATWKLAPASPTVVTLTEDWEILVRPVIPTKIVITPSTVSGGSPVRAEVTFSSPSTGTPVMLESSAPEIASVPENAETDGLHLTFPVETFVVEDERTVEISVLTAGVRKSATLTVNNRKVEVDPISFNRRNIVGTQPVIGNGKEKWGGVPLTPLVPAAFSAHRDGAVRLFQGDDAAPPGLLN